MKNKFLLLLIVFINTVMLSHAQERTPKSPEERAKAVTKKLDKNLSLSEEQKEKVYQINLETAKQNDDLRNQVKIKELTRADFFTERKVLEKDRDAKIEALLTEEQKPKYEEMKAKARQRLKNRAQNRRKKRNKNTEDIEESSEESR